MEQTIVSLVCSDQHTMRPDPVGLLDDSGSHVVDFSEIHKGLCSETEAEFLLVLSAVHGDGPHAHGSGFSLAEALDSTNGLLVTMPDWRGPHIS